MLCYKRDIDVESWSYSETHNDTKPKTLYHVYKADWH